MVNTPSNDKKIGETTPDTLTPQGKIDEVTGGVLGKSDELLEGSNSKEKKEVPEVSQRVQKYLEAHNISEQNKSKCISLIKQIGELIFSKKLESKGKKLKSEIEELFEKDNTLNKFTTLLIVMDNSHKASYYKKQEIIILDLIPIIVETVEYERRLVGQYRRNKGELLEKLKKSEEINVGGNKASNNIASLTVEELTEIFSSAENAAGLDFSSYDLDLLSEEQFTAIFSNLKNIKIADLSGTNFTLGKAKGEIIFSNLEKCETLNFGMNIVTDEILELMVKYLKNIKSIDFTMCELTQEQKDFIEKALPNTKFDFGDDM